jgi:hypothetical protein
MNRVSGIVVPLFCTTFDMHVEMISVLDYFPNYRATRFWDEIRGVPCLEQFKSQITHLVIDSLEDAQGLPASSAQFFDHILPSLTHLYVRDHQTSRRCLGWLFFQVRLKLYQATKLRRPKKRRKQ